MMILLILIFSNDNNNRTSNNDDDDDNNDNEQQQHDITDAKPTKPVPRPSTSPGPARTCRTTSSSARRIGLIILNTVQVTAIITIMTTIIIRITS